MGGAHPCFGETGCVGIGAVHACHGYDEGQLVGVGQTIHIVHIEVGGFPAGFRTVSAVVDDTYTTVDVGYSYLADKKLIITLFFLFAFFFFFPAANIHVL